MADATQLPELVREFTDLSKEYMLQETVEQAKQLGRYTGVALGAALLFAIGIVMLSIAGFRYLTDALPEGPNWSALAYLITIVVLGLLAALLVRLGQEDSKRT